MLKNLIFAKTFEVKYIDEGFGNFSKLVDIKFEKDHIVLTLERSEYNPSVFGSISTLETKKEIVIPQRSNEVSVYRNMFSGFGGGTFFGVKKFEIWTKKRVEFETNNSPKLKFVGLVTDLNVNCSALAYRGFVDKIKNLPSFAESAYGNLKYSELIVLKKSELRKFLIENKDMIVPIMKPIYNFISETNL